MVSSTEPARLAAAHLPTLPCPACLQVREIGNQIAPEPFRWTAEALLALQEVRAGPTVTGITT